VEKIPVADGQAKEQITARHVIDDLHRLQDGAGAQLAVPGARREENELLDTGGLYWLWDRELEVTPEVTHGVLLHVFDEGAIPRDFEVQLVVFEEPAGRFWALEVQAMPINDGAAAQNEAQRLYVMQREILDTLQASRALA